MGKIHLLKSFLKSFYHGKRPFLLSLFLHLCLVALFIAIPKKDPPPLGMHKKGSSSLVEVTLESKIKDKMAKQIIQQKERPRNNKVPQKTRFLGRYNQNVPKETVRYAKNVSIQKPPQKEKDIAQKALKIQKKSSSQKRKASLNKFASTKKEVFNHAYHQWKEQRELAFVKEPEEASYKKSNSFKVSSQFDPGTEDHIKGVARGLETRLSSRQFVYYSYYNRIREQVNQYWRPNIRQKIQDLALANKYIHSDHVTRLKITLNSKGYLIHIKVLKESGLEEIDSVALQAFEEASPFPNPPKGLIQKDGTIHIHWSFILEI